MNSLRISHPCTCTSICSLSVGMHKTEIRFSVSVPSRCLINVLLGVVGGEVHQDACLWEALHPHEIYVPIGELVLMPMQHYGMTPMVAMLVAPLALCNHLPGGTRALQQ